ncbi:hypothetical protein [Sagittula sp. MA-2]|jgi:hypothetical protein|uniref:hypothetical protein n=1 Tax=Sagittula sp. MA-2 TaxID=3048007 RepID=UPI0024C3C4D7|nr:hypothetical protein [Sagittula sp. MA-2]WHZ36534.1 hypothetical protein QNI11_05850 [Sagittula sp. MA-2]
MKTIDVLGTIKPKSDQLNADDLLAGPQTIRIRDIKVAEGDQQPLHIFFEGDDGRPWKPALTARRVLIAIWGGDASKWIGMSCTIFNDESVKWAGAAVGGIRISHMEGLSKPRTLQLTTTRGKRAGTTIQPLAIERESKADKFRARLFEVAEDAEKSVAEAWAKVPGDVKAALGEDLLDQLLAIEAAAHDHRENDPSAAVDALNESLG